MKLIGLDVDGVLNSLAGVNRRGQDRREIRDPHHGCTTMFKEHVDELNRITRTTDAKLLLISTWRMFVGSKWAPSKEKLFEVFRDFYGIEAEFIGQTPRSRSGVRGYEIADWFVTKQPFEPERFLIIDDDSDMAQYGGHLLKTRWATGLTPELADQAIEMLNNGFDTSIGIGATVLFGGREYQVKSRLLDTFLLEGLAGEGYLPVDALEFVRWRQPR